MNYSLIQDISIINSFSRNKSDFIKLFENNLFSDKSQWNNNLLNKEIIDLEKGVTSPLKKRMSQMSCGIFNSLEDGPGKNLLNNEEIYLFTAFGEIDTTDKIIKNITVDNMDLVSPTLFHNSVHNTPLGYYTIIKKINNYCGTISDGTLTGVSFVNFLKRRTLINDSFVITSGEEYSSFFDLDKTESLTIRPCFISYRITPGTDKGFKYLGYFNNWNDIKNTSEYKEAKYIIVNKNIYDESSATFNNKIIMSEYPIVLDNPCAPIFRLALPFYFQLKNNSLVIEIDDNKIHLFEVKTWLKIFWRIILIYS